MTTHPPPRDLGPMWDELEATGTRWLTLAVDSRERPRLHLAMPPILAWTVAPAYWRRATADPDGGRRDWYDAECMIGGVALLCVWSVVLSGPQSPPVLR